MFDAGCLSEFYEGDNLLVLRRTEQRRHDKHAFNALKDGRECFGLVVIEQCELYILPPFSFGCGFYPVHIDVSGPYRQSLCHQLIDDFFADLAG